MISPTLRPLFLLPELKLRIETLAAAINRDFAQQNPVLICVLQGAFVFLNHLKPHLTIPFEVDFIRAASYEGTQSSGHLKIIQDVSVQLRGRSVLIIEDIVDTGLTLKALKEHFQQKGASVIKVCTLLEKKISRSIAHELDFVGFEVPDEFVVGFGMDADGLYRELDYIGVLTPTPKIP